MCETSNNKTPEIQRTLVWDGEVPFGNSGNKTRGRVVLVREGETKILKVECTTKSDAMGEPHWEVTNPEFTAACIRVALLAQLTDKK